MNRHLAVNLITYLHAENCSSGIDRQSAYSARTTVTTQHKSLRIFKVSTRAFNRVLMRHINQRPCTCRADSFSVNGASTNWLLLGVAISSDDTHSLTNNKELTGFYAINSFVVAFK